MHHDPEPTGPYLPPPPGERFAPGTVLAGRYRVVAALGRGGMGEVYRADDLSLGQPVALKFLPEHLAADGDRLARFRKEVAAARKVSQPNVCRVYDLAEHGSQPFLTMEYIDGEDLASLLKRVGRVPEVKGIEIARQLCGALAAVHDQGLLHRDLKPANVMLDGRGRVRLTDFGLAAAAEDLSATEVRSGTPLYQAPVQAAGREVTARSDVYALGLVLYELFTGRRAFADAKRDAPPSKPSSHVAGLNPAVERVILRCLEPDPAGRPRSAAEVLAALAAGETPSPKLVADAGEVGLIRPWVGLALLAAVLIGIGAVAILNERVRLFSRVPFAHPPAELAFQARQLIGRFGYSDPPADTAWGIQDDVEYLDRLFHAAPGESRWLTLAYGRPAGTFFWYRQSQGPLTATRPGPITPADPPLITPGMATALLDVKGRLVEFHATPDPGIAGPADPNWNLVFAASGLDRAAFRPVDEPPHFVAPADRWMVWVGTDADRTDIPVRVEAAAYRGRLVYLRVTSPGAGPSPVLMPRPAADPGDPIWQRWYLVLIAALGTGLILLARANLRTGRADRVGAARLAGVTAGITPLKAVTQPAGTAVAPR
ncbi:MAG: serine/threonine protein kinase [Gemmataceae bacterium]|nr:serine/threonine protein kinase [Gemmataceae bacterium]